MFSLIGYILPTNLQKNHHHSIPFNANAHPSTPNTHNSNPSQATKSLELKPRHTSNLPFGNTQFCLSTSQ